MSRYIDADKLWNDRPQLLGGESIGFKAGFSECMWGFSKHIKEQISHPTADVVEVRHGEWIYHECVSSYDGTISGYACSVCNAFVEDEYFEAEEYHKKFCGNCGAKMDGGKDDAEGGQ